MNEQKTDEVQDEMARLQVRAVEIIKRYRTPGPNLPGYPQRLGQVHFDAMQLLAEIAE